MKRRLIGEILPIKQLSEESSNEKYVRHGHISTFHLWWARRPLAATRATLYASLINPPTDSFELDAKEEFMINLSKWKNSNNLNLLQLAKKEILETYDGSPPKILDPFAGGGSIPLEGLRLGCETFSNDYNPVACFIQKCILEFPQKYNSKTRNNLFDNPVNNKLLKDVKKWAMWVFSEARQELNQFYPPDDKLLSPAGFIWARTIPCQNPNCGAEIPLLRQFWLSNRLNRKVALYPYIKNNKLEFKIVGDGYEETPPGFNPSIGTTSKAIVTCLICGRTIDGKKTRRLFQLKKNGERMIAIILTNKEKHGKVYRVANVKDVNIVNKVNKILSKKRQSYIDKWGIDPIPNEIIHTPDNKEYSPGNLLWAFIPVVLYGMTKWGDVFNVRQKLSMTIFLSKIHEVFEKIVQENDKEHAIVIVSYLAVIFDKLADKNSNLARYNVRRETIEHIFGRQALQMVWDYVELNPFTDVGWPNMIDWVCKVIEHCSHINNNPSKITHSSATSLPYDDNFFDAVITDPPYYDNIPYATISDFFYVWLKRSVGHLFPDLFATSLAPKSNEAIAQLPMLRGMDKEKAAKLIDIKTKNDFEKTLSKSLTEVYRVLKLDGIVVLVYAHKSTDGWETLINSILNSGLVITGAWPIHTEMKGRLVAHDTASLASSIYMVARKWKKEPLTFYKKIKEHMKNHLEKKLELLWAEGISGADFFISAIGSSIEVFGKYEKIIDDNDQPISTERLLNDVRKIVTDYAMHQVLHNGFSSNVSHLTRLYVLWRWSYRETRVLFDDALKMSQSLGIDIESEWNKGFIKKEKDFIRILGPNDRQLEKIINSNELIDVLHSSILLWKNNKREEMISLLQKSGYRNNDTFYRVAQAISEANPNSQESKLIDGFLMNKTNIMEATTDSKQTTLI